MDRPCYDPGTMRRTLQQEGFWPCDMPACNCDGWHPSTTGVGFYARFLEIENAVEPGNGESVLKAVRRLKAEIETLRGKTGFCIECERLKAENAKLRAAGEALATEVEESICAIIKIVASDFPGSTRDDDGGAVGRALTAWREAAGKGESDGE